MTEVKIITRENTSKTTLTIYVRCTVKRQAQPEPTGVKVPVGNWNTTLKRVVPKDKITEEQADIYNKKISDTYLKVIKAVEQLTEDSTREDLKRILNPQNRQKVIKKNYSVLDVMDVTIEHSSQPNPRRFKKDGGEYASGTIDQYMLTRKALEKFVEQEKVDLSDWEYVENDFYIDFRNYLYGNTATNNHSKLGPKDSNVDKHIKHLQTCFNYVQGKRKILPLPVEIDVSEWNRVKDKNQTIVYLLPDELNILKNMKIEDEKLDMIRDLFCVQEDNCLRFHDLNKIRRINFTSDFRKLTISHKKTDVDTFHIQSNYTLKIIEKYKGKLDDKRVIPNVFTKRQYNNNLKKLIKMLAFYIDQLRKEGILEKIPSTVERAQKLLVRDLTQDMRFTFKFKGKKETEYAKIWEKFSNHDARSTRITGLILQGELHDVIKKKSGHSSNSEAFFRYFEISEEIMNEFISVNTNNSYEELDLPEMKKKS